MRGTQSFNLAAFHPDCRLKGDVSVLDIGGYAYIWCKRCGDLCQVEAIGIRYMSYVDACKSKEAR